MPKQPEHSIAVLMPVYNPDARALALTLGSLYTSTLPLHVVVVDDGSAKPIPLKEGGVGIHTVTVLRQPANLGITAALNRGLGWILSRDFTYVARMDNGHICPHGRMEAQTAYLEAHPDIALVGLQTRTVDEAGRVIKNLNLPTTPEAIRATIQRRNPFVHSTLMFRADVLKRQGGYNPAYSLAQDYELELRLSRKHRLANVPDPVFNYVVNPKGSTVAKRVPQLGYHLKALLRHGRYFSAAFWLGIAETLMRLGIALGKSYIIQLNLHS